MDQAELRKQMVDRFLAWPLPDSVCSDPCVTANRYPNARSGTNLLTADEAEAMLAHVVEPLIDHLRAERDAATEALYAIADMGEIRPAQRARAALARLPRAVERARLKDAVVAAARDVDSEGYPGKDYGEILGRLGKTLAALDAHDQGEGGG